MDSINEKNLSTWIHNLSGRINLYDVQKSVKKNNFTKISIPLSTSNFEIIGYNTS